MTFLLATGLAVTGCAAGASDAGSTPTPTRSVNAAEEPCRAFEDLTDRTATAVVDAWNAEDSTSADAELDSLPDEFDMLALQTDGAVGERIATVADMLQEGHLIVISTSPDDYFDAIEAVQRACAAEDVEIGVATWK